MGDTKTLVVVGASALAFGTWLGAVYILRVDYDVPAIYLLAVSISAVVAVTSVLYVMEVD